MKAGKEKEERGKGQAETVPLFLSLPLFLSCLSSPTMNYSSDKPAIRVRQLLFCMAFLGRPITG